MVNQKVDYQEMLKRIHITPSLFFFGQNYLAEAGAVSAASESSENEDEAQRLLNYREILSLKWSAVLSSSFDAKIPKKCGDSFSFEAREKYNKTDKIDKTERVGYFLFGQSNNGESPSKPDLDLDSSAQDTFSSVLKKTLDSFGIVIISGWDIENDWITAQILFNVLKNAPKQSVLLFGVQGTNILENKFIKRLVDLGILSEKDIIEDSLYSFLQQNGFFDTRFDQGDFYIDSNTEALSLYSNTYKNGRLPFVLRIQNDAIYELNSKSIAVITDTTGVSTVLRSDDNLMLFCACKGDWSYYAPHNKLIKNREVDVEKNKVDFYEHIYKLVENTSKRGKKKSNYYICVTGIHYSGKTALLKNFALRNKNKYPIFYIENYVDGVTENLLREFCNSSINIPEEFSRKIIVICDFKAISDYEMHRICQRIKETLSEISGINPVVIGTTYSDYKFGKTQLKTVSIPLKLKSDECNDIKKTYNSFPGHVNSTINDSSIFELISRYYRYKFSPDAADLRTAMNNAHAVNQTASQENVDVAYETIVDGQFDEVIKKGILPSFSNSLKEEDERWKEIKDNLKRLNDCIALASEFGIELPANFVFRALGWSNYRFLDALKADCFLMQTENGYRYISAYEAGKYLLFNYTDNTDSQVQKEEKLKNQEAKILCNIIETCNWNNYDESFSVISLIRKFSPNSTGKERNILGYKDKNENSNGKNWAYYESYYAPIGKKLLQCSNDNPIAVTVASAFLRRAFCNNNTKRDLIDTSYNSCKQILQNEDNPPSNNERVELIIEICNTIIAAVGKDLSTNNEKWDEFTSYFQWLIKLYDTVNKLDASIILNIWFRAVKLKATNGDNNLFEQSMYYVSAFLADIQSEHDFNFMIRQYSDFCAIFKKKFEMDEYKHSNLKGWLLYQQRNSYQLESSDYILKDDNVKFATEILSCFNESTQTKAAVISQPVLLRVKILCDWIFKFHSLPYAEENPISFNDTDFWKELIENINKYLELCDDKNPPAAFVRYIKCVYSLVFEDASYHFEENVRYSKKLSPWYLKRIGVSDENKQLLQFVIGTNRKKNTENFMGFISDENSILKKLKHIHLSKEVQKYLSEGKIRLSEINSIPDKPINIFFNAAGATAAIPRKEGGETA